MTETDVDLLNTNIKYALEHPLTTEDIPSLKSEALLVGDEIKLLKDQIDKLEAELGADVYSDTSLKNAEARSKVLSSKLRANEDWKQYHFQQRELSNRKIGLEARIDEALRQDKKESDRFRILAAQAGLLTAAMNVKAAQANLEACKR